MRDHRGKSVDADLREPRSLGLREASAASLLERGDLSAVGCSARPQRRACGTRPAPSGMPSGAPGRFCAIFVSRDPDSTQPTSVPQPIVETIPEGKVVDFLTGAYVEDTAEEY